MSTTYLTLVNDVLLRMGETQLTSSTWSAAREVQLLVKEYVNSAIRDILEEEQNWIFLERNGSFNTVANTQTYLISTIITPNTSFEIDWETFYIEANFSASPIITAAKIDYLDYKEWLNTSLNTDRSAVSSTSHSGTGQPSKVFRTYDEYIGLSPVPDTIYPIKFVYFIVPTDLSAYTDTMVLPDHFKHSVVDQATWYMYAFREDPTIADRIEKKFKRNVIKMRSTQIDRKRDVRSRVIVR